MQFENEVYFKLQEAEREAALTRQRYSSKDVWGAMKVPINGDQAFKKEDTVLYANLGLTVQEAICILLRRSARMQRTPFPMSHISQMGMADTEIHHYLTTGKGLETFKTSKEAFDALDQL